jgi:hypothetical protein
MLALYLLLLGSLALLTAYTRNFQSTIVALSSHLDAAAGAHLVPNAQRLRTMALLAGWPIAVGLGVLFVAWWKAMALALGAFLLLAPALGALTPAIGSLCGQDPGRSAAADRARRTRCRAAARVAGSTRSDHRDRLDLSRASSGAGSHRVCQRSRVGLVVASSDKSDDRVGNKRCASAMRHRRW